MKKTALATYLALLTVMILLGGCSGHPSILHPKGLVAFQERQIIFDTAALMLIVVIPVIVMSFVFLIHYRKGNATEEYLPDWHHSVFLEVLWWGIPIAIVTLLAIITWYTTHKLDPYRKLDYPGKVLSIKVIALPWKWLFIYDEAKITTVNQLTIPKGRQIEFSLSSDNVPMSAFFIPELGSQIYVMAGMQTKLHLVAGVLGPLQGFNAQYNGIGFDAMHFNVNVVSQKAFATWQATVKKTAKPFNKARYLALRKPTTYRYPAQSYNGVVDNLLGKVMHAYMLESHPTGARI